MSSKRYVLDVTRFMRYLHTIIPTNKQESPIEWLLFNNFKYPGLGSVIEDIIQVAENKQYYYNEEVLIRVSTELEYYIMSHIEDNSTYITDVKSLGVKKHNGKYYLGLDAVSKL